jgi:CRISPR-associated protein (TIGR02710 family)
MTTDSPSQVVLLICTVGGSPQPIVASILHWIPSKVQFVVTPESERDSLPTILDSLSRMKRTLTKGVDYNVLQLDDGQDFHKCIDQLATLNQMVHQWRSGGVDREVVVDFTGGTKCMSAAIAVQTLRWCCEYSYVGAVTASSAARDKGGVGIVVDGKEQILHVSDPWGVLGYRALEDFVTHFNQRSFQASIAVADLSMKAIAEKPRKNQFMAIKALAEAYDAWDRFDHRTAIERFNNLEARRNDLIAMLGQERTTDLLKTTGIHRNYVEQVRASLEQAQAGGPSSGHHILDLLANAQRRRNDGRVDDAVARLYRVVETIAQWTLANDHGISSTAAVPSEKVPQSLLNEWASRGMSVDGDLRLGLQDAYALLKALGDPRGEKFANLGLGGRTSPLNSRNSSILAHGFERIDEKVYTNLWKKCSELWNLDENDLPQFPTLTMA